MACSVDRKETREASQTERASTEELKNKVEMHEESPVSVSEKICNLDEPRQCSNWSEDTTEDYIWSPEISKHGASMFH